MEKSSEEKHQNSSVPPMFNTVSKACILLNHTQW